MYSAASPGRSPTHVLFSISGSWSSTPDVKASCARSGSWQTSGGLASQKASWKNQEPRPPGPPPALPNSQSGLSAHTTCSRSRGTSSPPRRYPCVPWMQCRPAFEAHRRKLPSRYRARATTSNQPFRCIQGAT